MQTLTRNHPSLILKTPEKNKGIITTSETEDAIKLFSLRVDVDRINNENISKLPTIARSYKCLDHFKWQEHHKDDKSLEKNTREASDDSDTLQVLVSSIADNESLSPLD